MSKTTILQFNLVARVDFEILPEMRLAFVPDKIFPTRMLEYVYNSANIRLSVSFSCERRLFEMKE